MESNPHAELVSVLLTTLGRGYRVELAPFPGFIWIVDTRGMVNWFYWLMGTPEVVGFWSIDNDDPAIHLCGSGHALQSQLTLALPGRHIHMT